MTDPLICLASARIISGGPRKVGWVILRERKRGGGGQEMIGWKKLNMRRKGWRLRKKVKMPMRMSKQEERKRFDVC